MDENMKPVEEVETPTESETPETDHAEGPTITIDRIDGLCFKLVSRRIAVAMNQADVARAREKLEQRKLLIAETVGEYDTKWQYEEAKKAAIAASEEIAQAKIAVREAEEALIDAQAILAGTEERISLYRAWMYGHARMPR